MCPNPDVLFKPARHPYQFSASGYLLGSFQPTPDEELQNVIRGTFFTSSSGLELKASIKKRDWEKLIKREDFEEDAHFYWRCYFRTTSLGSLTKIELHKPLKEPPLLVNAYGETLEEITDLFQVRGVLESIFQNAFSVRVERNELPPKGQEKWKRWQPFYLRIQGKLPEEAVPQQFWELLCTREGDCLRLKKATLMTEEMVVSSEKNKSLRPLESSQIIMINGRQPEITVKFSSRPSLPAQGKKVTLQVTGENGIVVKAELNRKTLKKQVDKMDSGSGLGSCIIREDC